MNRMELDLPLLTRLASDQVEHVSCVECCKYYVAPETAACGHTLCHTCWRGRRSCPYCAAPLERSCLKFNLPIQLLTEKVHALSDAFEKIFNIKLNEIELDVHIQEAESGPSNNVKDWLASSQNHFSAPFPNTDTCTQDFNIPVEISSSKIQVHTNSKKSKTPDKVVYVQPPQDDWDKIEQLPDPEPSLTNKENVVIHTNHVTKYVEDDIYSTNNPRRSSRKRENVPNIDFYDKSLDKRESKNSSSVTDKKSAKQNWTNVKKMRKEFSKLNKIKRNKLNVSIEMCKKTQNTINKPINNAIEQMMVEECSEQGSFSIEDNTPTLQNKKEIEENRVSENQNQHLRERNIKPRADSLVDYGIKKNMSHLSPVHAAEPSITSKMHNSLKVPGCDTITHDLQVKTNQQNISNSTNTQNQLLSKAKMPFIKKGILCPKITEEDKVQTINIVDENGMQANDDIEITIKVGNTLTNIVIKKKNNDIQLKVNSDREVQTSLGSNCLEFKNNENCKVIQNCNQRNVELNIGNESGITKTQNMITKNNGNCAISINKTISTKKNTASAETATAQFEITESVEKELSNIMECVGEKNNNDSIAERNNHNIMPPNRTQKNIGETEDADIFDIGSTHESNVQTIKGSKHAASEILMPTVSKRTQNYAAKRDRENYEDDEIPCTKKIKPINQKFEKKADENNIVQNSESMNYDAVMDEVFASIDADIEKSQKPREILKSQNNSGALLPHSQIIEQKYSSTQIGILDKRSCKENNEKCSENIFSIIEKATENNDLVNDKSKHCGSTQKHIENLLTPGMCHDLDATEDDNLVAILNDAENCTPCHDPDDSDRSVVEETPQKSFSFSKQKNSESKSNANVLQRGNISINKAKSKLPTVESVISVSDSLVNITQVSKDTTVIDAATKRQALETPLTITNFVDQIKHKSTPVARKSLNFNKNTVYDGDDPEQTFCPSSVVAKTTQEKEFMTKAFEQTQKSPIKIMTVSKSARLPLKYCIAGSCLTAIELTNVKALCRKYNWKYVDKYTKELTHLVVSVDEENKSQRSVKYMCALAASKWIVSYEWVDACITTNTVAAEMSFEVLDGTGEPGPNRSRTAQNKLFHGITFYCLEPFSVLDLNTLKDMLEAAGGRVVNEPKAVKAIATSPALLLAEPENTQEDRFMYLALELGIVPVNYEWVLNCLGRYTLGSIHDLLLCPSALLPPATAKWPAVLINGDSD